MQWAGNGKRPGLYKMRILNRIDRKDKVIVVCRITSPKDLFILLQNRKPAACVTHMASPKGITALSGNYDEACFTDSYADWDEYMRLSDNVRIIKVI